MPKKGRRKIKDLVDMLEDPENSGYVGGDYEDIMEQIERELAEQEQEDQETKDEE
ncbi:MAG: hypothetical protein ACRENF_02985 [Thermodesulfobacteriota bacterium]